MNNSPRYSANKETLYGPMWCIGGVIGTLAEMDIFLGSDNFGAIQFIRGLKNSNEREMLYSTQKNSEFTYNCKFWLLP